MLPGWAFLAARSSGADWSCLGSVCKSARGLLPGCQLFSLTFTASKNFSLRSRSPLGTLPSSFYHQCLMGFTSPSGQWQSGFPLPKTNRLSPGSSHVSHGFQPLTWPHSLCHSLCTGGASFRFQTVMPSQCSWSLVRGAFPLNSLAS